MTSQLDGLFVSKVLMENKNLLMKNFGNSSDFVVYEFEANSGIKALIAYVDGLVDKEQLNHDLIKPFILNAKGENIKKSVCISTTKEVTTIKEYVAFQNYNQEMIPTGLLITMIGSREDVPFPAAAEIFFILLMVEILVESGTRLPKMIGSAVSIVGALVIGNTAGHTGKFKNSLFKDFLKEYYAEGIEPMVGIVEKKEAPEPKLQKTGYILSDEGSAVFLNDKLVGFLNGKETRAVNLIREKLKNDIVTSPEEGDRFNSVEIIKAKSKNGVKIKDNGVEITVNIDLHTTALSEINSEKDINEKEIKELEDATSKVMKEEVEETIKKVQNQFKSDVFGFGKIVHQKNSDEWKKVKSNWNELFSKAWVNVDVTTTIRRHGLMDVPLKSKEAK